jgi:hypothetical protein
MIKGAPRSRQELRITKMANVRVGLSMTARFKFLCGFRASYPFFSGLCFPMQIGQGE